MQSNDSEKKKPEHRHAVRGVYRAVPKDVSRGTEPDSQVEDSGAKQETSSVIQEEIIKDIPDREDIPAGSEASENAAENEASGVTEPAPEEHADPETGSVAESPEDREQEQTSEETEAAAPEKKERSAGIFKVGAVLLSICAAVTLILSLVNFLTFDAAEKNKKKEIDTAIRSLFPKSTSSVEEETAYGSPISGVYKVMENDTHIGYAVGTVSNGFGGEIEMLVGIENGGKIRGVKIISLSETPNVGSRVDDDEYLSGYKGKSGTLKLKEDIDAISGASISSKAVLAGVNSVLALGLDVEGVETEDDTGPSSEDITDTGRIEPDPELETRPVSADGPEVTFDTYFRAETAVPEREPDETSILEIITVPPEEN